MNQLHELTTRSFPLLSVSEVSDGAWAYITNPGAIVELLGCWRTEIGALGRLLILRGFATAEDLALERKQMGDRLVQRQSSKIHLFFAPRIREVRFEGVFTDGFAR